MLSNIRYILISSNVKKRKSASVGGVRREWLWEFVESTVGHNNLENGHTSDSCDCSNRREIEQIHPYFPGNTNHERKHLKFF